ncbi:MAG: DUF429 domain-containing protein [Armatimonadota bacterium]|nr:DUF429 domain-containing protein [Armatimonadota bacterium]MCX7777342.1 DUF429 domain-containing protein [Armatimonadota bacterium]MDW8025390.1 DUF429 domain-containing protein [Armatimonadota bacterium]
MSYLQRSVSFGGAFVGVDVPGSETKPFFVAVLISTEEKAHLISVEQLIGLERAIDFILQNKPCAIAIDAPQPLCSRAHELQFEEFFKACGWARNGLRECERELIQRFKIRCFPTTPTTFASFRRLILIGWRLYAKLISHGYRIAKGKRRGKLERWLIEVYPHATFVMLAGSKLHPKAKAIGRAQRLAILERYISGILRPQRITRCADELDAIAAALTAFLWWHGKCIILGSPKKGGCLVIPKAHNLM